MDLAEKVLSYEEEMLQRLSELIAIESVNAPPLTGKPFGEACAGALSYILNLAESMGFKVKNLDNYVGFADYGDGEEYAAVVAHVDVVPAGPGWHYPPFRATIENDTVYGRGTVDDKGPAIAALYCLKAIKELGIKGRKMRLIFGSDEEVLMRDLDYYCAHEKLPLFGFSPDGGYPIYNREKGILNLKLNLSLKDSVVKYFEGGTAYNVVPQTAFAVVKDGEFDSLCTALSIYNGTNEYKILAVKLPDDEIRLDSPGKASHAKEPELGYNACLNLVRFLEQYYGIKSGKALAFTRKYIGMETDGASLGITFEDELSGKLTLNVGKITTIGDDMTVYIDIRYPISDNGMRISNKITEAAKANGFTTTLHKDSPPLYVPENSPIIKLLSEAYEQATGEKAELCVMGGGTYARKFENTCVSFGMDFEGGLSGRYHQSDEQLYLPELRKHLAISVNAMALMITG